MTAASFRIALLTDGFPPDGRGGAESIALREAEYLARVGHEVLVVSTTRRLADERPSPEDGYRVVRFHSDYPERWRGYRALLNPPVVRRVADCLSLFRPHAVHAHNVHFHLSYATLAVARRHARRVVLTFHDAMAFDYGKTGIHGRICRMTLPRLFATYGLQVNPLRGPAIRAMLRCCDIRLAVSESLADALRAHDLGPVEVLHNGVSASFWGQHSAGDVAAFRAEYGLSDRPAVLFGGRVSALKGVRVAVDALDLARKSVPSLVLMLAAEQPAVRSVREYAHSRGLPSDAIVELGWLSPQRLRAAYAASVAVLVLSQYLDPFPTIVLEAMAAGSPVIATNLGGAREAVEAGISGHTVDPMDASAVAAHIVALERSPMMRAQMSAAARARVRSAFEEDTQFARLLEYLTAPS
jgi:glycogen(starch) synthase